MPPDDPLFSVLIATHNHAGFITQALDSVAHQSCTDFEIIIVDDGSDDETPAVVRNWVNAFGVLRNNRVAVLTTPNRGQSAALEHGIGWCTGRYICLLDSDDWWRPGKLEAVQKALDGRPDLVMLGHPLLVAGPSGEPTGEVRPSRARLSRGDLREQLARTGRSVAAVTSGVVVRADVMRALRPFPTTGFRFGADGYITTGASLMGPVEALPEALGYYRIHPGGQYFRRMLSDDGPRLAIDLSEAVARHFGLERHLRRSSYFTRHAFAEAKLRSGAREQLRTYGDLVSATARDTAFGVPERAALVALWTACLPLPKRAFLTLWRRFQMRHMGLRGSGGWPEAHRA